VKTKRVKMAHFHVKITSMLVDCSNIFLLTHAQFLKHTNEFDFHTHECDLYTQSLITTCTSVMSIRRVWFVDVQLWFLQAEDTDKCYFYTQRVIFRRTSVISTLILWFLTHTRMYEYDSYTQSVIYIRTSVIFTHIVWFSNVKV
jgi:hypothetical protein